MREINLIVVHCSATRPNQDIGVNEIRKMHVEGNGWKDIGYHYVIRRSGKIELGRPIGEAGAHVKGHNEKSLGICLVGGVDMAGAPDANFTFAQYASLKSHLFNLGKKYPGAKVCGHRDLSPDLDGDGTIDANERIKECPCFSVDGLMS